MNEPTSLGKPVVSISLDGETPGELRAHNALSALIEGRSFHEKRDARHPLGIYNASISRISDKLAKAAKSFEDYSLAVTSLENEDNADGLRLKSHDYIELLLYSSAEHVDDVDTIMKCFFSNDVAFAKNSIVRKYKRTLSPIRSRVSAYANIIKHAQSRIRFYAMGFDHGGHRQIFHGVFFEGFKDGALCPSPTIHGEDQRIFSTNSLFWEVITFLNLTSELLGEFLQEMAAASKEPPPLAVPAFAKAVVAVARLPIYSFDEVHPFERVTMKINTEDYIAAGMDSGIYGSLSNRWSKIAKGQILGSRHIYEGDGVTRSFRIVDPKALRLQHWT